jgi:hypothetical protein
MTPASESANLSPSTACRLKAIDEIKLTSELTLKKKDNPRLSKWAQCNPRVLKCGKEGRGPDWRKAAEERFGQPLLVLRMGGVHKTQM